MLYDFCRGDVSKHLFASGKAPMMADPSAPPKLSSESLPSLLIANGEGLLRSAWMTSKAAAQGKNKDPSHMDEDSQKLHLWGSLHN